MISRSLKLAPVEPAVEQELVNHARASGGEMGFAAIHIETSRRLALNSSVRFPMASTYKLPIAIQLLTLIDEGKERLEHIINLEPKDTRPGGVPLTDELKFATSTVSVRDLLEMMLTISDNTASDVILRLAGGPQAVTARIRLLDIEEMSIDRSTMEHLFDHFGLPLPPESEWDSRSYVGVLTSVPEDRRRAAAEAYARDPRDTSTPDAMASLLLGIYQRNFLKPETTKLLLGIMRRCRTGEARLKGLLPAGTEVAHKSGTAMSVINDVGIITLPNGAGHIVTVVFIKGSKLSAPQCEHSIAEVARIAYDYFLPGGEASSKTRSRC